MRIFQQTYLGLLWYSDYSAASVKPTALSPEDVYELKFKALANRSNYGRWVKPSEGEEFVHHYESQMRDHMWGTSNRFAADANEYHLGFEEFHRFTATGVPIALGGVLYYDPEIAPEPSQVRWGISNPFDLTYNPFTDPEVLEQAESGEPVPLAVYTYYSNMALKPIITIDFFRPNNPRVRQSATYWRRVVNEALASSGILGFVYNGVRRVLTYAANRKGITWLSDSKKAYGVDELRYSLMSTLYFEDETLDRMLHRVDRLSINPLIQSTREQRLRALLQYEALLAEDGRPLLDYARWMRGRLMKRATGTAPPEFTDRTYSSYRKHLEREEHLKTLDRYLVSSYLSTVSLEDVKESIRILGTMANGRDDRLLEELADFRFEVAGRLPAQGDEVQPAELVALCDESLSRIYRAIGRTSEQLLLDLGAMEGAALKRKEKEETKYLKQEAGFFEKELKKHILTLGAVAETEGDLVLVSPWHLVRAVDFLNELPEAVSRNPWLAKKYRKKEQQLQLVLEQAQEKLQAARFDGVNKWLENERISVVAALSQADSHLQASLNSRPSGSVQTVVSEGDTQPEE
jgi:hypothetical protein